MLGMSLKKALIKKYMLAYSAIGKINSTWEGYSLAQHATTEEEKKRLFDELSG